MIYNYRFVADACRHWLVCPADTFITLFISFRFSFTLAPSSLPVFQCKHNHSSYKIAFFMYHLRRFLVPILSFACTRICLNIVWGPGDVVLDGDPALPLKDARPPDVGPCLLWSNGWMDEDATWYGSSLQHKSHCVRRGPSFPPAKGSQQPPTLRPMSTVATVAHLSCCKALVQKWCRQKDRQKIDSKASAKT